MEKITTLLIIEAIDKSQDFYTAALELGFFNHDRDIKLKMEGVLVGLKCVKGLIKELEG